MVILQLGRHRVMMISHQIPGYFSSKFSNIRTEFSGVSARDTQKFDEKNRIKEALPMGKANTSVNQWLRDNHRFASLYNGYVFGGRQIIRPEELEDLPG